MKSLVFLAAIFISIQSNAQIKEAYQKIKQSATGSAKISQPHYLTSKWEVLAQVGLTLGKKELKASGAAFDAKLQQQTVNTALTFGVLDYLSIGINWDYDVNLKTTYEAQQPDQNYKGIKDPVLNITGRAGDFDLIKIDLKLAYQPKTGDFKTADTNHDGNALNGYRTTTVGAEFDFLITNASQVFITADYNILGERDLVDQTTGAVTKGKSLNSTMLKIGTLTEIMTDSFFGVTYSMFHQDGGLTRQSNGTSTFEASEIKVNALTASVKHEFTPNSAVNFELEHILNGTLEDSTSESKIEGNALSIAYLVRF